MYSNDRIRSTQFALEDSNFFSNVTISPGQRDPETLTVPVTIRAEPIKRDRYTVSLGYGTDTDVRGRFAWAGILIIVAGVMDNLDGRIARLTGTESDFGREFDSLADVLTFGFAPALVAHLWGLQVWSRLGWLIPLYFVVCCATRLARFNVQTTRADLRYSSGSPARPPRVASPRSCSSRRSTTRRSGFGC